MPYQPSWSSPLYLKWPPPDQDLYNIGEVHYLLIYRISVLPVPVLHPNHLLA